MTRPTDRRDERDQPARSDFLTTFDLGDRDRLERLCRRAQDIKLGMQERRLAPTLSGRVVGMLFEKASTRTRVSFEAGIQRLGGGTVVLHAQTTQLARGEPIKDSARVLCGYVDAMVIRTHGQDIVEEWARYSSVPIVNALTDLDHPCQILTDALTIWERDPEPYARPWAYIGDGNNMANGYIALAGLVGLDLRIACPKGYAPDASYVQRAEDMGATITVTDDVAAACKDAKVLLTDVWASMGQEDEAQARQEAFAGFQIDQAAVDVADDPYVLHCLPAHRGEEIADDVIEGPNSVIFEQAHNRMVAQLALLEDLLGASPA